MRKPSCYFVALGEARLPLRKPILKMGLEEFDSKLSILSPSFRIVGGPYSGKMSDGSSEQLLFSQWRVGNPSESKSGRPCFKNLSLNGHPARRPSKVVARELQNHYQGVFFNIDCPGRITICMFQEISDHFKRPEHFVHGPPATCRELRLNGFHTRVAADVFDDLPSRIRKHKDWRRMTALEEHANRCAYVRIGGIDLGQPHFPFP
jgi:hypothetical protein